MSKSYLTFLSFCAVLILGSCVPPTDEIVSDVQLDFRDADFVKIKSLADKMDADSLYPFFHSNNATHRYLALSGFASVKLEGATDSVAALLDDPNIEVRAMAAYVLGQMGSESATQYLIDGFVGKDTLDIDNEFNAHILEALGKVGNVDVIKNIASVKTYRKQDTSLLLGQIRALYRFGLRQTLPESAINTAVRMIGDNEYPYEVRLMAANLLARNKDLKLEAHKDLLLAQLEKEKSPFIRMCLGLSFRNLGTMPELIPDLLRILDQEKDYRVKVYLIKALESFSYIEVVEALLPYLDGEDIHLGVAVADYLYNKGNASDFVVYQSLINSEQPWQIRYKLHRTVMHHIPLYQTRIKASIVAGLEEEFNKSTNVYEKAAIVQAVSEDPYQYIKLLEWNRSTKEPVVKTAIAEGLKNTVQSPNFINAYGGNYLRVANLIADSMEVEAEKGFVGVVSNYAGLLKTKGITWKNISNDSTWLERILDKLKLPKDIEAFNDIKSAAASIKNESYTPLTPEFNHPIDWSYLSVLTDSSRLVMKTTKGNIVFRMFADRSPGTVANFLKLCKDDYYDGKTFHRVVPNFVVQGGCPIGDGYGGLDYSIRSELQPLYYNDEGYVGMASAGNHTEGVQFFITHSPTPHLDGRYTIFAKIVEGMDVVHKIQVGDQIIDAILIQ